MAKTFLNFVLCPCFYVTLHAFYVIHSVLLLTINIAVKGTLQTVRISPFGILKRSQVVTGTAISITDSIDFSDFSSQLLLLTFSFLIPFLHWI